MHAWKGILDADGFVIAGWVQDVRLQQFSTPDGVIFVIKGKVKYTHIHACSYMYAYILVDHFLDQALSMDAGYATATLGQSGSGWCCISRSMHMHGRVMILYDVCYI